MYCFMNIHEALQSGHGSGANERLDIRLRHGIVRFTRRIPWHRSKSTRDDGAPLEIPATDMGIEETLPPDAHIVVDVLPHDPNDRTPVVTYPEIDTIMKWAGDSDVKDKIYQLESGPKSIYQGGEQRKYLYYEYYNGSRDDEGNSTLPENSTFFKAVNSKGEMIAVTTVRWRAVPFVRRGRTAYRERTIVKPEFRGGKIGTVLGIKVLDDIFYRSEKYDGLPATEARSSIYIDRQAGRHDINHNYLTLLGFIKHGDPIWIKGRQVQPYRLSLAGYEEARPIAIGHFKDDQPKMAEHYEKVWPELREALAKKDPTYARNFS